MARDPLVAQAASQHFQAALRANPEDVDLRLQLASSLREAERLDEVAEVLLPQPDVHWPGQKKGDARRSLLGSALLGLEQAGRAADVKRWRQMAVDAGVYPSVWQRPGVELLPGMRAQPWWESSAETSLACLAGTLEMHWQTIHKEYQAMRHKQLSAPKKQQGPLSPSFAYHQGAWRYLSLFKELDGQCSTFNEDHTAAQQCDAEIYPGTCAALRSAVDCQAVQGPPLALLDARFSILAPGSHIKPHCGRTNARLVAHLGLSIPHLKTDPEKSAATMRVGCCESRTWEEGKLLVFDDSFDHEVKVDRAASGSRAVLIVQVAHPDLRGRIGRSDISGSDLAGARTWQSSGK